MDTSATLTKRQREALDFIHRYSLKHGFAPSLQEIAKGINITNVSTAQYYVEQLRKKNYLSKTAKAARGIKVVSQKQTVPLLGVIAAGEPIEPIENPEPISIPPTISLRKNYQYYALRVRGDSMEDMGILDDDTVLIRHQLTANHNDVVVAITEHGATLKVYKNDEKGIRLEARNKKYAPITPSSLEIRGIFAGLIRVQRKN